VAWADFGRSDELFGLEFIGQQQPKLGTTKRPTKLYKNEADIALGARAFDAVVLTLDAKRGPRFRSLTCRDGPR